MMPRFGGVGGTGEVDEISEVVRGAIEDTLESKLDGLGSRYLGSALTELINQATPKDVVKTRPGRGGAYPYVPLYWVTSRLNSLFGFLWDVVIDDFGVVEEEVELEEEVIPKGLSQAEIGRLRVRGELEKKTKTVKLKTQVWVAGHLTVTIPGRTVTTRSPDGSITETRIDSITITKHAFGGTDIKYYSDRSENAGMIIDLADDYKSAMADMLKKAASYLGVCADVYGMREDMQETGPSEGQLKALYKRAESKGLDKVRTAEQCRELFNLRPEEMNPEQYLKFMSMLLKSSGR